MRSDTEMLCCGGEDQQLQLDEKADKGRLKQMIGE
jgi:hypothetical protein